MSDRIDPNLHLLWNTLMFFSSESSYTVGERTGGVLEGCPRKPPPTHAEMAGYARRGLVALRRHLGIQPDEWMLDGGEPPALIALDDLHLLALASEELDEASGAHERDGNNSTAESCRARAFELRELGRRLYAVTHGVSGSAGQVNSGESPIPGGKGSE